MKLRISVVLLVLLMTWTGRAQRVQEWKLDLRQYGLVKGKCAWYPGYVGFLDDDHLVVGAPVGYSCAKGDRDKVTQTRFTVIDLKGNELASIQRVDVVKWGDGPDGTVTVCTGGRIEFLGLDLQTKASIADFADGKPVGCLFGGGLSPSRKAIYIQGPAMYQHRLYRGSSAEPISEITIGKGESVRAVTDDAFLVCTHEKCDVMGPDGVERSFLVPQLYGRGGYAVKGFVAPDNLLLEAFDGKHLVSKSSTGGILDVGDLAKITPRFSETPSVEFSAIEPRRILYSVDGCLLGDFDDCYGEVFHRFAVFDWQSSRTLFRHRYRAGAHLKISPNGHLVMEQDGATVRLFRIP